MSFEDHLVLKKMNSKLIHRGPDAQNTLMFDNVAFGFTRLSIIGLENGMQPIYNESKDIVLICNGEIFNYIELKQNLKSRGHLFTTDSDVEVIIHLYEEKGTDFLNDLNGQFAFALYDKKRNVLFCARDQMGIIPFFYTFVKNTFIFGSEIKAILEHPLVAAEVDLVGLDQIISFPGLISPRTMFRNIHSLENGHFLLVDDQAKITDMEYWDLPYEQHNHDVKIKSEAEYVEELGYHFENAVKLRLRADVPTGFYLSGGLDSSMIAMKVDQFLGKGIRRAFSIDFPDSQISEAKYQNLAAEKSHASLYQKTFYYSDISERLHDAVYHCECPIKETYNTASLHLSQAVRDNQLKVILSGEGADEFFAGYVGYRFDKMREEGLSDSNNLSQEEYNLRRHVWGDGDFFYESNLQDLTALKKSLYSNQLRAFFEDINCMEYPIIKKEKLLQRDTLHKRSYMDYKLRLVDHLISDHGDRMAMANSVEVRYPFLDKDLVEFSTTIPSKFKLNNFTEKYILRKLAEKSVPREILEREKFGFVAPGSPYLLQRNIEYINDILSYETIKRQGFFDPNLIERLKKQYSQDGFFLNVPFETDLLIIVITFGIFLEQFFEKKVPALS
ncbi:Asparagine synthetase [Fulvivirga imtechensis AK7]|uniref:asparagine synthase (glutamine-hydrolyzing) n=2 Tax=Fulvivirga TaxID=396811 RepID=L8JXD2_9BACT|nr:Asparagine synthetase [Fulvivirga imtechensis AK7]